MPKDAVLVIETSTPVASVALVGEDGTVVSREFTSDRSHNAALFGPLRELLGGARVGLVLVGSGPGSYSGTRVGIAAAQGVAMAMECPAVAVPSILAVPGAENAGACLAIGDARRGSYWTSRMEKLRLVEAPALCDAGGLSHALKDARERGMPVFAFEDPARFGPGAGEIALEYPNAAGLWRAWLAADENTRAEWQASPPQPLYLKPPHITAGKRQSPVAD